MPSTDIAGSVIVILTTTNTSLLDALKP